MQCVGLHLPSSALGGSSKKRVVLGLNSGSSSDTELAPALTWDFLASRTARNKFLFISHLACGIVLPQPEQTKTIVLHQCYFARI